MAKKILIANTGSQNCLQFKDLFNLFSINGYLLYFYSQKKEIKKYCEDSKYFFKKAGNLTYANTRLSKILFIILLLPLLLFSLTTILIYKIKYKIDIFICFDWQEKILFTPWAKLCGQKIIWIECPGPNKSQSNFFIRALTRLVHKHAQIIIFNQKTKDKLKTEKYKIEHIQLVPPGINLSQSLRQENIFHDLAKTKNSENKNNFYTLGTIVDLNKEQEIEIILGAIKKALSVIPNLQFIIIGDGTERKNLTWLAKKMGIGNLVWFVGEQAHLHKWLNSFNIFITAAKNASFTDMQALLHALSSGIPVITPYNHGFDDIINDNINGLIAEKLDSDTLSSAIIKINQDKKLAEKLSQNGKITVTEKYTDKIMAENFIKLL
ncbi:MAG: hypothetical protein US83_C0017G0024 [Candidatus Falkowbacteria bacterium GW2011_GWC2_38_22]|uniref:Glycosyl transferase family 1 domain-containing protein n=1 Tax=Candidatus Falkowbacteria bacterium GW2011_GWE1_38_31 TaxID=1618638 RepID=A0A0G0MX95_9BACT|nr:MAG: hypothetical protein US73_C0015G0024 [Candidatus Falkowbacteria bacterium GW2011_GWF2_38_1205]KKQ60502.1 MAG: hypothetical protein US83_C0017G0024 [Candidatus Falkowbacteria bacterium GW2011_GWC2_38_22]KKQ62600.1 MAG: hypothetical protein US84_C0014G0024 [Candidatus Falkowbacteria bacterium GW2011_GWF1_38_22]KKQ64647.1 MAG: hypothetical protein US87_C0014G0024 [Candidatus Falkowbacteria bacterium GW2011_GWE2_38_254]KKQ69556.1 MAG: hypothetical protein US91_C0013G0024 [Candidatus Falkowb